MSAINQSAYSSHVAPKPAGRAVPKPGRRGRRRRRDARDGGGAASQTAGEVRHSVHEVGGHACGLLPDAPTQRTVGRPSVPPTAMRRPPPSALDPGNMLIGHLQAVGSAGRRRHHEVESRARCSRSARAATRCLRRGCRSPGRRPPAPRSRAGRSSRCRSACTSLKCRSGIVMPRTFAPSSVRPGTRSRPCRSPRPARGRAPSSATAPSSRAAHAAVDPRSQPGVAREVHAFERRVDAKARGARIDRRHGACRRRAPRRYRPGTDCRAAARGARARPGASRPGATAPRHRRVRRTPQRVDAVCERPAETTATGLDPDRHAGGRPRSARCRSRSWGKVATQTHQEQRERVEAVPQAADSGAPRHAVPRAATMPADAPGSRRSRPRPRLPRVTAPRSRSSGRRRPTTSVAS